MGILDEGRRLEQGGSHNNRKRYDQVSSLSGDGVRLWETRFKVERKMFTIRSRNEGVSITIIEEKRDISYLITMEFEDILWLIGCLKRAAEHVERQQFFSKHQSSQVLYVIQRLDNKSGTFIRLSKFLNGSTVRLMVFPAGVKGKGWLQMANEIVVLLKGKQKQSEPSKLSNNTTNNHAGLRAKVTNQTEVTNNGVRKRSFVEVVKSQIRACSKDKPEEQNRGARSASYEEKSDSMVIVVRQSLWDSWKDIEESINKLYCRDFTLKPFQPDKALFYCQNKVEAEYLSSQGLISKNSSVTFKLQSGNQAEASKTRKLSFTGGWIEIMDLPVKWWNNEIFKAIGHECGGLEEIHCKTENKEQLFAARIKTGGKEFGFIPAEMDFKIGEEKFTIKVRVLSALNLRKRPKDMFPPYVGHLSRCKLDLGYLCEDKQKTNSKNSPLISFQEVELQALNEEEEGEIVEERNLV